MFKQQLDMLTSEYLTNSVILATGKNFKNLSKISAVLGDKELACLLVEAAKSFEEFLKSVEQLNRFVKAGKVSYAV